MVNWFVAIVSCVFISWNCWVFLFFNCWNCRSGNHVETVRSLFGALRASYRNSRRRYVAGAYGFLSDYVLRGFALAFLCRFSSCLWVGAGRKRQLTFPSSRSAQIHRLHCISSNRITATDSIDLLSYRVESKLRWTDRWPWSNVLIEKIIPLKCPYTSVSWLFFLIKPKNQNFRSIIALKISLLGIEAIVYNLIDHLIQLRALTNEI